MTTNARRRRRPRPAWGRLAATAIAIGALWLLWAHGAANARGDEPGGMVWIPGGEFWMAAQDLPERDTVGMQATRDARPIHRVHVDGFWMDSTVVTNAEFARFVNSTGYVTVAERTPRAEDFPGAPPENLVAATVVFAPPNHPVPLNNYLQWWSYVPGASWRHPEGPSSDLRGRERYPVVQVAYEDAEAYCSRYAVGTRGKGEVSSGANHLGFRCVKDAR